MCDVMATEGSGSDGSQQAPSSSGFHDSIPRRCLFTPRSEQEQVILDTMGAAKTARIAKRDAVVFLRQSIEPHVLLHPTVIRNSRVFHALHEFLLTYATGSNALEYPSEDAENEVTSRRKIVKTLYRSEDSVMQVALPIIEKAESLDFNVGTSAAAHEQSTASSGAPWPNHALREKEARQKRAVGVAARFTTTESKYDGLPNSDIHAVQSTMRNAIQDFDLEEDEARRYVHNCFTGNAKRFFDSDPRFESATTVSDVFQLMRARFLPAASRAAITNMLDNLSIAKELQENSPRDALDSLYKTIERSMPHVLEARSGDRNAGMFLRRAVLSETWAAHPCQQFTQDSTMTFAQFHAALTSAIVTEGETGSARARAYSETHDTSYIDYSVADDTNQESVWYGGSYAGLYSRFRGRGRGTRRSPTFGRRGRYRSRGRGIFSSRTRFRDGLDRLCWRCGLKGHISVNCTMPDTSIHDAVRARVREVGETPTALSEVLYALADEFQVCLEHLEQLDTLYEDTDPPSPTTDAIPLNSDSVQVPSEKIAPQDKDFPQPSM